VLLGGIEEGGLARGGGWEEDSEMGGGGCEGGLCRVGHRMWGRVGV